MIPSLFALVLVASLSVVDAVTVTLLVVLVADGVNAFGANLSILLTCTDAHPVY